MECLFSENDKYSKDNSMLSVTQGSAVLYTYNHFPMHQNLKRQLLHPFKQSQIVHPLINISPLTNSSCFSSSVLNCSGEGERFLTSGEAEPAFLAAGEAVLEGSPSSSSSESCVCCHSNLQSL